MLSYISEWESNTPDTIISVCYNTEQRCMLNLVRGDLVVDRVDVDVREEGGQRDQQWHLSLKIIYRSDQFENFINFQHQEMIKLHK